MMTVSQIDSIIAVHGAGGAGGRRHAAHAGERVWLVAISGPGGGGWLSLYAGLCLKHSGRNSALMKLRI